MSDVLERITHSHGVSMADYLVLGVIRGAPESRTSPGVIADTLNRTTGGTTLTLDRLAASGWVKRSRDPSDGRRAVVELTREGMRLALEVNRSLHEWESSLPLGEPPERVNEVLASITAAVEGHAVANA